jgi:hypothetical protein
MSAKITVIVYILICFEVGILLLILPWTPYWEDNFFLYYITNKLNAAWVPTLLTSGYVKGAVTGLGALNILAGLRDIFKFRESVESLAALGNAENHSDRGAEYRSTESRPESGSIDSRSPESTPTESRSTKSNPTQPVTLSDHRPPSIPPQP